MDRFHPRLANWLRQVDGGRLTRLRARYAVARLGRELRSGRSRRYVSHLVDVAIAGRGPTNQKARDHVLAAADQDVAVADKAIYRCLQLSASDSPHAWLGRPRDDDEVLTDDELWRVLLAPLLLAPAETRHRPPVRFVALLEADPDQLGTRGWEAHGWTDVPLFHRAAPPMLVDTASRLGERCPDELVTFLSTTDHPIILDALRERFRFDALDRLLDIVRANPHLPAHLSDDDAVLAVVLGRPEPVTHGADVNDLLRAVERGRPGPTVDACDAVLRALQSGSLREHICDVAATPPGSPLRDAARAVVIDVDYLPADPARHAPFFVWTKQWDRYDAADPTGELLYHRWLNLRESTFWGDRSRAEWLEHIAKANGRPNPRERWSAEH